MKWFCSRTHLLLYVLLYAATFRSGTLTGGNMQNVLVDMAGAIVQKGAFTINETRFNAPDVSYYRGNFYSGMAPGVSFLAVPVYAAAKLAWRVMPAGIQQRIEAHAKNSPRVGDDYSLYRTPDYKNQILTHLLMTLLFGLGAGAICFYLLCAIARELTGDEVAARIIALVFCLATFMTYYLTSYYTQSIGLFFLLLAIWAIFAQRGGPAAFFLGGVCASLAGTVDYPFYIYGGLIVLAALAWKALEGWKWPAMAAVCLGFAVPLALLMWFHYHLFGNPFLTPVQFRYVTQNISADFYRTVPLPTWARTRDLLVSPEEGLLWYAPVSLLFPFGMWHFFRRLHGKEGAKDWRRIALFWLMAALIATSIFHFTRVPWSGAGAAYGPRYVLSALPFMILLAYPFQRWQRIPFYFLAAASLILNHFQLLKIPLDRLVSGLISPGAAQVGLFIFPIRPLSLRLGLGLDLLYQAALLAVLFAAPYALLRRRRNIH